MLLHRRLPQQRLHMLAGVLFLGAWIVVEGALGWRSEAIATTVAVAPTVVSSAAAQTLRRLRTEAWYPGSPRRPATPQRRSPAASRSSPAVAPRGISEGRLLHPSPLNVTKIRPDSKGCFR